MRRGLLYAGLALLLVGAAISLFTRWYVQTEHRLVATEQDLIQARLRRFPGQTNAVLVPIELSRPIRLAAGGLGMQNESDNARLADLLTAELTAAPGLVLVERSSLDKILKELEMSLSGLVRARDAVRVGQLLGADWFVLGSSASVHGTDSLVIRVVDAHTGIMREGAIFPRDASPVRLASQLGSFVRAVRAKAATPRPETYLALGTFEDLSLNNREADQQERLRQYLTAVYQGGKPRLLEREYVNTLLQEMNLDLAGLSSLTPGNLPAPSMQSAYWLVDGYYVSTENPQHEVELVVNVRRIFGLTRQLTFRERVGEALWAKVRDGIDRAMAEGSAPIAPTKDGEIHAQMSRGIDLTQFPMFDLKFAPPHQYFSREEEIKRRRTMEEAIRAFQTVLLLDPENQQAKVYLAAVVRRDPIGHIDEARDIYRQLIESPVQDRWSAQAKDALSGSFFGQPVSAKLEWFTLAAQQNTNSAVDRFYQQQIAEARTWLVLNQKDTPEARELAAKFLFDGMTQWEKEINTKDQVLGDYVPGIEQFVRAFGTNLAAAGDRLAELLPKLVEQHPNLGPHLVALALAHQVNTNGALVGQFETSLKQVAEGPGQLTGPHHYFSLIRQSVVPWCMQARLYQLSTKALETVRSAAASGYADAWEDRDSVALGFSDMLSESWQQALELFDSFTNKPVYMPKPGPWGNGFYAVLPAQQANRCREKLGLSTKTDSRELHMAKPWLCLHGPGNYMAPDIVPFALGIADNEVWISDGIQLIRIDFNLRTNLVLNLPGASLEPATCICPANDRVWVGTAGAGIFELNRATKVIRQFTDADGLLMNHISQLCIAGDFLWIGYCQNRDTGITQIGGLGRMSLKTGEILSYTPSLKSGPMALRRSSAFPDEAPSEPPGLPVGSITVADGGDVWFLTHAGTLSALRHLRLSDRSWDKDSLVSHCSDLALSGNRLILGQNLEAYRMQESIGAGLGVSLRESGSDKWRSLPRLVGFPEGWVTCLKMAGPKLWVGGMGYLAAVDPDTGELHKFAYVRGPFVERIEVVSGYVWAQFDRHLYRAAL